MDIQTVRRVLYSMFPLQKSCNVVFNYISDKDKRKN